MRSSILVGVLCALLLAVPGWSQQTQPPAAQPAAPQDAQAVAIVNQVLALAGGSGAIKAIADYTATGNVTYHWNPEEQGTITIQGLGLSAIRIDANLPSGTHSGTIRNGQTSSKDPNGRLFQYPPPYPVTSSNAMIYQPPLFPSAFVIPQVQLAAALNNPLYSISYGGIVQIDGQSLHDIQIQFVIPGQTRKDSMAQYRTTDFFIDNNTFQVVMTKNTVPKDIVHQVRYSKYAQVSGIVAPFSINEWMGGQATRDIQIDQLRFNSGLQDSAFAL